jgi:hypothetical protein
VIDFLAGNVFLCVVCFRKMRMISGNSVCSGLRCYQSYCEHLSLIPAGGDVGLSRPTSITEVAESPPSLSCPRSSAALSAGIDCFQQHSVCLPFEALDISRRYVDAPIVLPRMNSVMSTDYASFVSLPSPSPLPWTQSAGTRQQIGDLFAVIKDLVSEVSTLKAGVLGLQEQLRLLTFASRPRGCMSTARSTESLLVKA